MRSQQKCYIVKVANTLHVMIEMARWAEQIGADGIQALAGCATAFFGKWGIGTPGTEGVPYRQGCDVAIDYYDQRRPALSP